MGGKWKGVRDGEEKEEEKGGKEIKRKREVKE